MDTLESARDERDPPPKIDIIGLDAFDSQNWPPHPGNYRVFNAKKAIGVVLLTNVDAATTCATLVDMQLVSQIDHAAYMGRELARVETCLLSDTPYVQDKAQGELECQTHLA